MSINQFPGGIVTKTPAAPTTSSAKGIWTLSQATGYAKQGIWPRIPSAPTIGTATAGASTCASVTFTAPTCVGAGALTYSVISTPGCISNTGASSPVVVSGLTGGTSYTFKVYGVTPGGTGPGSAASNSITAVAAGSQSYTSAGTYTWVAPTGVTSISIVAVGGGAAGVYGYPGCSGCNWGGSGGGGGALAYKNNYSVTPGNSYTVVVGRGGRQSGASCAGEQSYFVNTSTLRAGGGQQQGLNNFCNRLGGTWTGCNGGNGGTAFPNTNNNGAGGGGGGSGGYGGNGGNSGRKESATTVNATAGAQGGGGGGASGCYTTGPYGGGGGGGVGLLGRGSNGAAGTNFGGGGGGGSSGCNGGTSTSARGGAGGGYGGGGAGNRWTCQTNRNAGGGGAVRIIWPGTTRQFPSTCTSSP